MSKTVTAQEPFLRIAKRDNVKKRTKVLTVALAILAALVVDAVFIFLVTGLNPFSVYGVMVEGTFGNAMRFSWAIRDLASLLLVGIALAPAFKMKFWNIGAEGQILIGALATALVMVYMGDKVPTVVLFLTMFLASVLSGALWAFLPGFFKAHWKTNETLFTLMMNYVATSIVACATNILRGRASSLGKLNMKTKIGWFPEFLGERYNINILIVVILMFAMYFYLKYTKQGYEISVVGESENTARYAGINVKKVMIRTMLISGAICGLCGFLLVAGRDQTISVSTAGGRGFTAIIVAWLAKFNTFTMALISFLLIFLEMGAGEIASAFGLNDYVADIISGIILFFILGSEFFVNYKLIFRSKKAKEVQE
ncbi:MAG: ABC transporter permease [Lachnospiraceae bacterium]|nr:ABC transporter permease [Lachnospiraceae bacterium]